MSVSETPARPARGNCGECGAVASGERTFCEECGAFLRWVGQEEPAVATGPVRAADRAADGGGKGADGRAGDAKGGAGKPAAEPSPVPPAVPTAPTVPVAPAADPETAELPPVAEPGSPRVPAEVLAAERAHAMVVPVPEAPAPPAADPAVAPVLPGRPEESRPRVRATVGGEAQGGPECPWCGAGNPPGRRFCRRCGARFDATAGDGPVALPWWRRLLGGRDGEQPWAGQRPRLRRGPARAVRLAVTAAVLVLALVAAMVWTGPAVDAVTDHFADRVPVDPVRMTASRSYDTHGPELTLDKVSNSWWGSGIEGDGAGEWLEAEFGRPVRLLDLMITPGAAADPAQQLAQARPRGLELLLTDADGDTETRTVELSGDGPQRVRLRAGRVTKVRLVVRSAYGVAPGKQVAVAEVEFFGRKS
ncbi:zinc ribbon domain-containing protein [Kitasatospora sp. NPDC004240]